MHCDEHFGQEGDKLGVSSTKSVVDILPQTTSSREENTFFVCCWQMEWYFFYKILILFSTLYDWWLLQLIQQTLKVFSQQKKLTRKWGILCSIVSSDSATFVTCSQLWCWWSQIKQVISAPWRPTTPCCLFPCTKMVKLFPFKGNKSWCSSWDRKTARTKSK